MSSKRYLEDDSIGIYSKRSRSHDADHRHGSQTTDAHPTFDYNDYTIAWVTALALELAASRAMFDEEHESLCAKDGDHNTYVLGRIARHNVVMTCLPSNYGLVNAANVSSDIKRSFPKIRATLMVGIGGGVPREAGTDIYLGDVVVGTSVIQHDLGKVGQDGRFKPTALPRVPSPVLLSAVAVLRSTHEDSFSPNMADLLQDRCPGRGRPSLEDRLFQPEFGHGHASSNCAGCDPTKLQERSQRPTGQPRIHYGMIASGDSVMKHGETRDRVAGKLNAVCFEMEAAGMMDNLHCLPVRGICDYSDSHKNKEWQGYAAATAATYARALLEVLAPALQIQAWALAPVASVVSAAGNTQSNEDIEERRKSRLERRKRLLKSLYFPQLDARMQNIRKEQRHTCSWFIEHTKFQVWLDATKRSYTKGFLWMRGKPGAGKSTIMKFAYEQTRKNRKAPDTIFASFFFNAQGADLEKSIDGMYRSLLLQLLTGFPEIQFILDDIAAKQQDCPSRETLKNLFDTAIDALRESGATFQKDPLFICFIDALDECDVEEVRDMVEFFEDLTANRSDQLYICFASRPYPEIAVQHPLILILQEETGHGDDLRTYVTNRLRLTNQSKETCTTLTSQIIKKSAGIFMWVVLVVEILNKENVRGGQALKTKLNQLPTDLSELFRSIIKRDNEDMDRLRLCIHWVLYARRPLSPAEFCHAMWAGMLAGILKEDEFDGDLPDGRNLKACIALVTSSSKGLAEVSNPTSKSSTVQFIHESVRDFLLKDGGLAGLWSDFGPDWEPLTHEKLKLCCSAYLDYPAVAAVIRTFTIGNVEEPQYPGCDCDMCNPEKYKVVQGPSHNEDLPEMGVDLSFLDYAGQQVLYHADRAALADVDEQDNFVAKFLSPNGIGIAVLNLTEKFEGQRYGLQSSPLYILADRGLGNLVRARMKTEKAFYNPEQKFGHPLFAAMAHCHDGAVAALLGLPSTAYNGTDLMDGLRYRKDSREFRGRSPLSWAAQHGNLNLINALLDAGEPPNAMDSHEKTPIMRANARRHVQAVRLLLDRGAEMNLRGGMGLTALQWASHIGHLPTVRVLVEHHHVDVGFKTRRDSTALALASRGGHEAVLRYFLARGGAEPEELADALYEAAGRGHLAVVKCLLDHGVDCDMNGRRGIQQDTPLMYASIEGHEKVVQLLIDHGADISAKDNYGNTALIRTIRSASQPEAVVRCLLSNGADVFIQQKDGDTALDIAIQEGHQGVIDILSALDRKAK